MKAIKNILSICSVALLLGSCQADLLETKPYGNVAAGNMWTSENFADKGVTAIYSTLRKSYVGLGLYQMDCLGVSTDCRDADYPIMRNTITTSNGMFSSYWSEHYSGISRANDAIVHLPEVDMPENKKARYMAEAKVLRAYFYYKLNIMYKGVPVYLEPVEASECTKGQETEAAVWQVIEDDLTAAINEPNLPNIYTEGSSDYGRVTKGLAYALRGKTYLYMKDWKKAIEDFEEIVYNKTNQYGYKLYPDYSALFTSAGPVPNDNETIFAIQNKGTTDNLYGMALCTLYGTRGSYGGGRATCMPSVTLADIYEEKDGQPFDWNNHIPGYNENDAVKKKAFLATLNSSKQKLETIPDTALLGNIYRGRDPRMMQSLIVPYSYYNGYIVGTGAKRQLYAIAAGTTVANGFIQNDRGWNVYFYRKFVPIEDMGGAITNRNHTPINFPVIRFADVLLMLAEAYNEDNQLEKAIVELNKVRNRQSTKMPGLNSGPAWLQVTEKEEMFERIMKERAVELIGEGHRFSDLRRWGLAVQYLNNRQEKDFTGEVRFTRKFTDRDYLWPIPSEEIQRNPALKPNNPGW